MSLLCSLQVTDFSNFYLEKQKQTEMSVFGPQRIPAFTNTCTSSIWHYFYFLFIYFHFFLAGEIKITLLSNSISIINTKDRQKYIKSRKAIAQNEIINKTQQVRYNQLLHHAKFVHHSFFKWSLWSNNFSKQNAYCHCRETGV